MSLRSFRLKKIEIFGFKSFADKTVIDFSEGITGIVGPNGCGKSNISDAFRWVLGEQSAKSMRGTKMPDVIFAGAGQRKPLNYCEVTITLTDLANRLPLDYGEVAITRRMHRSGESEYFINKNPARLKDIQSLFLDSGMGKDAFSIFEQGKIDQIIQLGPLERRYIFEEAAGILRFLNRKREALRKLEQTDQNLHRVQDILREVHQQAELLEEQAKKAKVFKENKSRYELLDKSLFKAKHLDFLTKTNALDHKTGVQQSLIEEASKRLTAALEEIEKAKTLLATQEKACHDRKESLFKLKTELSVKLKEQDHLREKIESNQFKEKQLQLQLAEAAEKHSKRHQARGELIEKQLKIHDVVQQKENHAAELHKQVKQLEESTAEKRKQQQDIQKERLEHLKLESRIENDLNQGKLRLDNLKERLELMLKRKNQAEATVVSLKASIEEKKQELKSLTQLIDDQKSRLQLLEQQMHAHGQVIYRLKTGLENNAHETTELKARQKLLIRLREENEGFSSGAKRLLKESKDQKSPLYQLLSSLYELITPTKGSEKAVSAALRTYGQTLVVKEQSHLEKILDFATINQIKDFSLICLEYLPKQEIAALKFAEENALAYHFLHQLQGSTKLGVPNAWLDKGIYIDHLGVMFVNMQTENSVFMRDAELKEIEKKIQQADEERKRIDKELKDAFRGRDEMQSESSGLDKSIRKEEMKLLEINFSMQRFIADHEKNDKEKKGLEQEEKSLTASCEAISSQLITLKKQFEAATAKSATMQGGDITINRELEQEQTKLKEAKTKQQDSETSLRHSVEENKKILHAIHILDVQNEDSLQQEKQANEELKLCQTNRTAYLLNEKQLSEQRTLLEKEVAKTQSLHDHEEKELTQRKKGLAEIQQANQKEEKIVRALEDELHRLETEKVQYKVLLDSLEKDFVERYQASLQQLESPELELDTVEQLEKRWRTAKSRLEREDEINMTAIDEFDKQQSRRQFLTDQIADLEHSKKELVNIITQLDGESRKIFKKSFEEIRANFKKNFLLLFQGGEADLQLTDSEDILEAGIEIIAKPPGKQMRSINLLSGGEKCLTAMALLFGIFEVKPAPFCILDEIDAPLDDSNLDRFLNMVKAFVECTQFIIITHNKRTMAVADKLCGVSMEEKGVSKMLSIQLSQTKSTQREYALQN